MEVRKLAQFDDDKGLTMQDAIREAGKRGLRILNNLEADGRLQGNQWESEKEMYPCWTGTLIAYEQPGKPLGATILYRDFTFNVPKAFQGKKDVAVLCNHPDFVLDGNELTPGKSAKCIPFPQGNGWYAPDREFGVPSLSRINDNSDRYLWRTGGPYIGLLARGYGWFLGDRSRRGVYADGRPSDRLGVFGVVGKSAKHKHEWVQVCTTCGVRKK